MFFNSTEPIVSIVDKYFKKQAMTRKNGSITGKNISFHIPSDVSSNLPDEPEYFVRDDSGRISLVIHGNTRLLTSDSECDVLIWTEEFIRDMDGLIVACRVTYPDGTSVLNKYNKSGGKIESITLA